MLASKILILILFGYAIAETTSSCGDWTAYKDEKCFKVFDSVAPEATAETICRGKDNDSVLAIIKTSEEQEFIEKYLKDSKIPDNVWIGIKKANNSFKWLDGTDVKYTNWAKDRPLKNSTDLNCVEISVDKTHYGKWKDDKCDRKNAILCEKIQPWSVNRLQNILLETGRELKEELDYLKTKTIPGQQKLIDSQKGEINKLNNEVNNLKSNPVPIGFIYVQLSGQSEANNLWPNTEWQNISPKYSGLFFRAEGSQGSTFGKTQEQHTQSLQIMSHLFNSENKADHSMEMNKWWTISDSTMDNQYFITGGWTGEDTGIKLKWSNDDIYPRNQAIRIWARIK